MDRRPIRGMEKVVATVSGYKGTERFNLIKLISESGANYVGVMSKSITHLICWRFEGKKYQLAKKFKNTIIVNHRWIEDCIKLKKRVSEESYVLQSGEEVGPLSIEFPNSSDVIGVEYLSKIHKGLSDKSNICEEFNRVKDDKDLRSSNFVEWNDSILLDENLFPEISKKNSSASKSDLKLERKKSKVELKLSRRECFRDPPLYGLVDSEEEDSISESPIGCVRKKGKISGHDGPSSHTRKDLIWGKRKIIDDPENTSFAESLLNEHKLQKKNYNRNILDSVILDSDEECYPIRLHENNSDPAAPSEREHNQRIDRSFETGKSDAAFNNNDASIHEAFDDIEEINGRNHLPVTKDSNSCCDKAMNVLQRVDGCSATQNSEGKSTDASPSEGVAALPKPSKLSCVICWTDFSSTRGALPCGHWFCYSCIQTWADRLISSGKISTCPLCKTSFMSIIKVEDAATSDQKIYSQTIPCVSATNILMLDDQERNRYAAESLSGTVCPACCCREPEDLLLICDHCQFRCIHIYCLDPVLLPWTCTQCKDLQRLYYRAR